MSTQAETSANIDVAANTLKGYFQTEYSDSLESTSLATPQDKLTLTTPALEGTYIVRASFVVRHNMAGSARGLWRLRNDTDNNNVGRHVFFGLSGQPGQVLEGIVTFTGSAKTFKIQWQDIDGTGTASIAGARIIVRGAF